MAPGEYIACNCDTWDHWLWEMQQLANQAAHERFLLRHVLRPIKQRWDAIARPFRPFLWRRLPMWSARRWRSVT